MKYFYLLKLMYCVAKAYQNTNTYINDDTNLRTIQLLRVQVKIEWSEFRIVQDVTVQLYSNSQFGI